jgi:nucleoid DNA-binding protein
MTKADLVEQVYEAIGPGVTKKDCAAIIDAFLNAVKQSLAGGEHIEIRGFGAGSRDWPETPARVTRSTCRLEPCPCSSHLGSSRKK